jgi:hypothetical protein
VSANWVAPSEDGGLLIDPPLADAPQLLEENQKRFKKSAARILGESLLDVRAHGQKGLEHLAQGMWFPIPDRKTPKWKDGPIIMAGHQPDLYHPGVWIKNFALSALAGRHGLNALNINVDTDSIKSTSVRMPTFDSDASKVGIVAVPFDQWPGDALFYNHCVTDQSLFCSVAERAKEHTAKWPFVPLLEKFWQRVVQDHAEREARKAIKIPEIPFEPIPTRVSWCFETARRSIEREWGCRNWELPWGTAKCVGSRLILHLLSDLQRFRTVYNECIRAFRRKHRIRSRNHPAPELAAEGDWLEAPFWVDARAWGRLGRLFVRRTGDRLDLRFNTSQAALQIRAGNLEDYQRAAKSLDINPRALTTTLLVRLVFADVFIHGIGGAKYDEVTDEIIRRYFGMEPPAYMVVSGTLRLPFPAFPVTADDRRRLQRRLRDVEWNPQKCVSSDAPEVPELIALWRKWSVTEPETRAGRRERFRALRWINEQLQALVPASERETVQAELARVESELSANAILRRRDYAFCLYPEELLRPFCTQFL